MRVIEFIGVLENVCVEDKETDNTIPWAEDGGWKGMGGLS